MAHNPVLDPAAHIPLEVAEMKVTGSIFGGLEAIPPSSSAADYLCFVVKRGSYVSLVLRDRWGKDCQDRAFTLHQVEARQLGIAVSKVAEVATPDPRQAYLLDGVEGISLGGPPGMEQEVESGV